MHPPVNDAVDYEDTVANTKYAYLILFHTFYLSLFPCSLYILPGSIITMSSSKSPPSHSLSDPASLPTTEENYAQVPSHPTVPPSSPAIPTMDPEEIYAQLQHNTRRRHPNTYKQLVPTQIVYSQVHSTTELLLPQEGYGQINTVNRVNPDPLPDKVCYVL